MEVCQLELEKASWLGGFQEQLSYNSELDYYYGIYLGSTNQMTEDPI